MKTSRERGKDNYIIFILMIIATVFFVELFFFTWCRVQCIDHGYEINRLEIEKNKRIRRQKSLKVEIERLKAPERIGKIAREKLGLHPPILEQVIVLP